MCGSDPSTTIDPTPQEAAVVQKDVELWNYYQDSFKPMIDKYIGVETDPTRKGEEVKAVKGEIKGEMMKNVDPSKSSPNPVENTKNLTTLAGATTSAEVKGAAAEKGRELGETEGIIQVGRGQETAAMGSMQALAQTATQKEIAEKGMALEKTIAKQKSQQGNIPCCFIFLASDLGEELLYYVRKYKDSHFALNSDEALGYKRLAVWVVPKMRKYNWVKQFVKFVMCKPMALYAKAYYEDDLLKSVDFYPISLFWGFVFRTVGLLYGEKGWVRYWKLEENW